MSRWIKHQTSPQEVRLVVNYDWDSSHKELCGIVCFEPLLKNLRKGFKGPQESNIVISIQFPSVVFSQNEGILFLGDICCDHLICVFDADCHCDVSFGLLGALENLGQVNVDDLLNDYVWWGWDFVGDLAWRYDQICSVGTGLYAFWEGPENICGLSDIGGCDWFCLLNNDILFDFGMNWVVEFHLVGNGHASGEQGDEKHLLEDQFRHWISEAWLR